ncbi:hypothetical protein MTE01_29300 [Microbacterium testaceum]|uniref:Uncharacterized protein n=1 Tax=Microbacterium testaceum TaxID=2033 RepID=A0A4Y3QNY8_MICTE|nr:hypothetical protein [Microbacterium testaceum]GEB46985.1 hypothetical protein MTE01_29300 [Microbacterium testaceum]
MTDTFGRPDADADPRTYLPTVPGLEALLERDDWHDASVPEQPSLRTLVFNGDAPGSIVLVFRDDLVDVVASRNDPGADVEQEVMQPAEVIAWLERWASRA